MTETLAPASTSTGPSVPTPPRFITFTGADDETDVHDMRALSRDYPVEFGILFSPKRTGTARYPNHEFARGLEGSGLRLAAHVCGDYSRELAADGRIRALEPLFAIGLFNRVQINIADGGIDPARARDFAADFGMRAILQSRDPLGFPDGNEVDFLYDCSGGTGAVPSAWPSRAAQSKRLVGFAGGLKPANVETVLARITREPGPYWIDMESGVRYVTPGTDEFSLDLCRAVCELAYPASADQAVEADPASGPTLQLLKPAVLDRGRT